MYKLYYSPGACSMVQHVMLNEIGVPYEIEKVDLSQPRSTSFLKINSRGQVPVLLDGSHVIREGAAIISYLAEKHPTKLLPQHGPEHQAAVEWMMFCNSTLHPTYSRVFFLKRLDIDAAAKEQAINAAWAKVQDLWNDVENRLSANKYLAGEHLTIADIMMTVYSSWAQPNPLTFGPNTQRVFTDVTKRASFQKASEAEGVSAKAAA